MSEDEGGERRAGGALDLAALVAAVAGMTDRISNAVALDRFDVLAMIQSGAGAAVDSRLIRLFLHEATHHAAFTGPLGWALSSLAASCAALGEREPKLASRDLIVDRFLFDTFQPLLEGTALFAEYDALWGESPVTSMAMHQALFAFGPALAAAMGGKAPEDPADALRFFAAIVARARLTPTSVEDKAHLLAQPLNHPARYFLGYLAVKRMAIELRRRSALARDGDFVLAALLRFFCFDETLARLALAANDLDLLSLQRTIVALSEYVQDRCEELYRTADATLKTIEADLLAPSAPEADSGFAPTERQVIDDLTFLTALRTSLLSIGGLVGMFKHRHVLRFGLRPVHIQVGEDLGVEVFDPAGGARLLACRAVPLADRGAYEGTIEAIVSRHGGDTAMVVLGASGLVAVLDLKTGVWNPDHLVEILDELPPFDRVLAFIEYATAAARAQEAGFDEAMRAAAQSVAEQTGGLVDHLYLKLALPGLPREARGHVAALLAEQGLAAVFPGEGEMTALAALSLAFGHHGRSIDEAARALGRTPEHLRDQIDIANGRGAETMGVPLFLFEGDQVVSAI